MLDSSYSEVLGCSELTGADQMSKNTTLNNSETNGQGIDECLHRCLAVTPATLVRSLLVVVLQPRVQIALKLLDVLDVTAD